MNLETACSRVSRLVEEFFVLITLLHLKSIVVDLVLKTCVSTEPPTSKVPYINHAYSNNMRKKDVS